MEGGDYLSNWCLYLAPISNISFVTKSLYTFEGYNSVLIQLVYFGQNSDFCRSEPEFEVVGLPWPRPSLPGQSPHL